MTPPKTNVEDDCAAAPPAPPASWLAQYYTEQKAPVGEAVDRADSIFVKPEEKYELLDGIGTGGMKSVRRALDRMAIRHIAMARPKEEAAGAMSERWFLREARITAALEHPNIVPVHEIGLQETGEAYFTMKLLGGETLHCILKKLRGGDPACLRDFPLSRLLEIFLNVCYAIAFAHSRGVIHLDLKPENVQVGSFGEVLVLDWGLARVFPRDGDISFSIPLELIETPEEDGVVLGTPEFMAPEQERGEQASLDERTDIYALGALLDAILGAQKSLRTRIPRGLLAVVRKARASEPADRYASVDEFVKDIRAYLGGFPTVAQEASAFTQMGLFLKRHGTITALCGIGSVLILAIFAISFVRIRQSEQTAVRALAQIKSEQERHRSVSLLAAPRVLKQADEAIEKLDYGHALSVIDYVLTLDASLSDAWLRKAAIHLGRLEFGEAARAWQGAASHAPGAKPKNPRLTLAEVATKYAALRPVPGGLLPADQAGLFVSDIVHAERSPLSQRLLVLACFLQRQNGGAAVARFGVVEAALRDLNRRATDLAFEHKFVAGRLEIVLHGSGLSQILPLIGLPISSLDLAGTSVNDLSFLRNAPLVDLDLSGTGAWEFQPLGEIATLETLRLAGWLRNDFTRVRFLRHLQELVVSQSEYARAQMNLKSLKQPPKLTVKEVSRDPGSRP